MWLNRYIGEYSDSFTSRPIWKLYINKYFVLPLVKIIEAAFKFWESNRERLEHTQFLVSH